MNTIKQHICWLDAVRVLACLLVCVIHAPIPSGQSSVWLSVYNYLSAPCIGLFFMVSGALLFPVRLSTRDFIRKRFVRILPPLLIWSIISVVVHYCLGQTDAETAISKICKLPFFPVEGVYWFMYAILGLYLFAPLLSPALEKMDNARYFVMIWTLTLIMPYINAWLPEAWSMQGQYSHILGEFPGYMGYMVLGYWLCRSNTSWSRYIFLILIPGSILAVVIPAYFIKGQYPAITHELLYGYLTVNVAALCLIYFTLVKKMAAISCMRSLNRGGVRTCCIYLKALMVDVSRLSFGIYLVHILIMRQLVWPLWERFLPDTGYAIQIPAVAIITFILCYLLIKALSYIPGSKYLF